MCLHATTPSLLSLGSPNNSETWALKTAQEKGAPSYLGSRNNIRCEAAPRTKQRQPRVHANSFHFDAKRPRRAAILQLTVICI